MLHSDINMLKTRLIDINNNDKLNALHIYPRRNLVALYNAYRQSLLNEPTFQIKAEHCFSSHDFIQSQNVSDDFIPQDDRDAGNLPQMITCSISTRVMLIRNINTCDGLVNGAMGTISYFHIANNSILSINILFDDPAIGTTSQTRTVHQHESISIQRVTHEYRYRGRAIIRKTFPLSPCCRQQYIKFRECH